MIQRIHHNLIRFGLTVSLLVSLLVGLPSGATAGEIFYPTGTYTSSATDLTVAARSIPMTWERSYRSNRVVKRPGVQFFDILPPDDGPLGYGWHSPWTARLVTTLFKDAQREP